MSGLALALERRQWETVALYLLAGVAAATEKLPPDSLNGLLDLLSEGGHRGAHRK
jgi:hypothetical protein